MSFVLTALRVFNVAELSCIRCKLIIHTGAAGSFDCVVAYTVVSTHMHYHYCPVGQNLEVFTEIYLLSAVGSLVESVTLTGVSRLVLVVEACPSIHARVGCTVVYPVIAENASPSLVTSARSSHGARDTRPVWTTERNLLDCPVV